MQKTARQKESLKRVGVPADALERKRYQELEIL